MKNFNILPNARQIKKFFYALIFLIIFSAGGVLGQETIFEEDFSNGELPTDWTTSGTGSWYVEEDFDCWGTTDITGYSIGACAADASRNTDLITKELDLSGYVNVELSFYHKFRRGVGGSEVGTLYYSINGGSSWTQINQWTATVGPSTYTVDLSDELDGESEVKLKWNFESGSWSYYWNIGSITLTGDPAAPGNIVFYNTGSSSQLAFNNSYINTVTPIFRVSATHDDSFDAFEIEINTEPDFEGTSYTQIFTGAYTSGTQYDLECNDLSSALPTTNDVTYYVRARASEDGGTEWGNWSSETYSFTYKNDGDVEWYQKEEEQFESGTLITASDDDFGNTGAYSNYNTGWGGYILYIETEIDAPGGYLDALNVYLSTAYGNIRMAVYDSEKELILQTAEQAAESSKWNIIETTTNPFLSAGTYYIAVQVSDGSTRVGYSATGNLNILVHDKTFNLLILRQLC